MKNEFRTSDFGLASTLVALEHQVFEFDRRNPKRVEFVFEQSAKTSIDVENFWNDSIKISPQKFLIAQRLLKNRLYCSTFKNEN